MKHSRTSGVEGDERGRTTAQSAGGRSKSELTLPREKQPAPDRNHAPAGPARIVVVDDHRFMREVIAAMLRRQDRRYQVLAEAADGKEAIDACRRFSPNLVLLDINLPDMSGIDLVTPAAQVTTRPNPVSQGPFEKRTTPVRQHF